MESESIGTSDGTLQLRLKEFRDENGISQKDMAEKLGINRVTYIYYESGKRQPSYSFISDFSKLSGWTPSYILGLSKYKTLEQEADASELALFGDSEAVKAAVQIRQTANILLNRYNKGDTPIHEMYLDPLARICSQVDKIQKYIIDRGTNAEGKLYLIKSAEFFPRSIKDAEFKEIIIAAHKACNDLLKEF